MFERHTLLYKEGGHVSVTVPRFRPEADVLFWDDRLFVYDATSGHYNEGTHQRALNDMQRAALPEAEIRALYTRGGQLVESAAILETDPPPDVILWGDRVFVYERHGRLGYYEGMLWPVMVGMQRNIADL